MTNPVWSSIEAFKFDLAIEHSLEDAPPTLNDNSPRVALREPIWRTLREHGPQPSVALRQMVLTDAGLNCESARLVNYHAWALVDLQAAGWVDSYIDYRPGKRGQMRKVTIYHAIKPRVRVRAVREAAA